jgi:hypothetical protein
MDYVICEMGEEKLTTMETRYIIKKAMRTINKK